MTKNFLWELSLVECRVSKICNIVWEIRKSKGSIYQILTHLTICKPLEHCKLFLQSLKTLTHFSMVFMFPLKSANYIWSKISLNITYYNITKSNWILKPIPSFYSGRSCPIKFTIFSMSPVIFTSCQEKSFKESYFQRQFRRNN